MVKNIKEKINMLMKKKSNNVSSSSYNNREFSYFESLGKEMELPEFETISYSDFDDDIMINIFLKYTEFRDKYIETYLSDYKYLRNIADLEQEGFDINYFLMLESEKKEILMRKKMLIFRGNDGKIYLGMYYPNIYIDFDYDEIFIFGNNIYNYFFGKGKDLSFLNSKQDLNLEELLQSMETMGINDIGIDPINESQYIITAEVSKKNVLLTERPILKGVIDDLFHSAMTKMNIDSTTEFPTTTGLLKLDLVGQDGIHVKRTFRINFIKVKMGYTSSIRKFMNYSEIEKLGLEGLGYSPKAISLINEAISDKNGINMILGETNSGKSTLLSAILNKIYLQREKIISIENPIEIEMPYLQIDLSDTETADDKFKMTKEIAQKGILRHNPNVVLMSEIRSADEIEFFAGLGLRGHMALATLHAGSVENAINILLKVSDQDELKSICNLFVHQELLAKVCKECSGTGLVDNKKCPSCNGNKSKGVVPVYEIVKFHRLGKDDDLTKLDELVKNGKAELVDKKELAEKFYRDGVIFEEDYKRICK